MTDKTFLHERRKHDLAPLSFSSLNESSVGGFVLLHLFHFQRTDYANKCKMQLLQFVTAVSAEFWFDARGNKIMSEKYCKKYVLLKADDII